MKPDTTTRALPAAAIITAALLLGACDKTPSVPPAPKVSPAQGAAASASATAADTSVPDAASVLAAAPDGKPDAAAAGRSNSPMSRAQESAAMPLPGQANDHSAPLTPAQGASAP